MFVATWTLLVPRHFQHFELSEFKDNSTNNFSPASLVRRSHLVPATQAFNSPVFFITLQGGVRMFSILK